MSSGETNSELNLLKQGADWLGLELTPAQLSQFTTYAAEMIVWNERFNLTAITETAEILTKHFLDSLTCFLGLPGVDKSGSRPLSRLPSLDGMVLMDVGAGAGFPGVPLAIVRPALSLTLLESVRKKTTFLNHLVGVLGLPRVSVLTGRAEDYARMPQHRECYDVAVARAVAYLPVLAEYCLPLAKVGGRFIAMKKGEMQSETNAALAAIEALGGTLTAICPVEMPQLPDQRSLVLIDKIRPTPPELPRRAGIPAKRPLGERQS